MKKYPFSVQKHAHSIEVYRNYLFNTIKAMENGEIPMDTTRYGKIEKLYYGELQDLYSEMFNSQDEKIVYLTGKQIALAQKIITWTSEQRANSLIKSGKTQYLKYC